MTVDPHDSSSTPHAWDAWKHLQALCEKLPAVGVRFLEEDFELTQSPTYFPACVLIGDVVAEKDLDNAFTMLELMQARGKNLGLADYDYDAVATLRKGVAAMQVAPRETHPRVVIRGSRRTPSGKYDTTVLLMKAEGKAYLTGFVLVDGEKRQVVAHINSRKPDPKTGEIKPNFLVISELTSKRGEPDRWGELGFGNALNRRHDGQPLYFDELLFKIGNDTLRARVTDNVDQYLHRHLGFDQPRVPRPERPAARPGTAKPPVLDLPRQGVA